MEPPAISGRFTLWPSWIAAQRTLRQGGRGRLVEVFVAVRVVGEIIDLFRPPGTGRTEKELSLGSLLCSPDGRSASGRRIVPKGRSRSVRDAANDHDATRVGRRRRRGTDPVTALASSRSRDRPARLTRTDSLAASCLIADRVVQRTHSRDNRAVISRTDCLSADVTDPDPAAGWISPG